ncbi:hypothetical protein SAMN03097699_2545 [Flavobacteriaceae bacterium MAR_2010_188]|nr:hypothetical protein SAMN03097699_2545 [Flavobacteriaceae bacterium MAR_2010_188]
MNHLEFPIREQSQIQSLLPHRPPMIMVGGLLYFDETSTISEFKVSDTNILLEDNYLSEAGLLENMAQTAALDIGYRNSLIGSLPREGYIAAIQKATITELPKIDDIIQTEVATDFESDSLRKVTITTRLNKKIIAIAQMTTILKSESE